MEQSRKTCLNCGQEYLESKMRGELCFDCYENGDEIEAEVTNESA